MVFRLLIDADVIDTLMRMPAGKRSRYLQFFRRLQEFPEVYSEFREADETGRPLDACVFDRTVIRYWVDYADRHVKILKFEEND